MLCMVELDTEDISDATDPLDWSRSALKRRVGDDPPFGWGPDPGRCEIGRWLSKVSSSILVRPLLPLAIVLTLVVLSGTEDSLSRPCFWRSLCCFRFSPWRRLMMISRILGRYFSKLSALASWLKQASRMLRSKSGTLPRSDVSTLMAVKARQAMLNS